MSAKFLRTPDNPSGWPTAELLEAIRHDIERAVQHREKDDPKRATAYALVGHLFMAEGLYRIARAQGVAFDSYPAPRLVEPDS